MCKSKQRKAFRYKSLDFDIFVLDCGACYSLASGKIHHTLLHLFFVLLLLFVKLLKYLSNFIDPDVFTVSVIFRTNV